MDDDEYGGKPYDVFKYDDYFRNDNNNYNYENDKKHPFFRICFQSIFHF